MTVSSFSPNDKPALVKTIAVLTLINGIVNIFWGLIATAAVVPTIVLACLSVFTILPTILGVFEIVYAAKLLSEPIQPVQPSQPIAILEILCVLTGNVFSMIVGILSLVFYNDPLVKEFFARLNGMPIPAAPTPPALPIAPEAPARSKPVAKKAPVKKPAPKATAAPKTKKPQQTRTQKASPAKPKAGKPKGKPKSGSSSS